jgi:hypothetical protein
MPAQSTVVGWRLHSNPCHLPCRYAFSLFCDYCLMYIQVGVWVSQILIAKCEMLRRINESDLRVLVCPLYISADDSPDSPSSFIRRNFVLFQQLRVSDVSLLVAWFTPSYSKPSCHLRCLTSCRICQFPQLYASCYGATVRDSKIRT